MIIDITPWLSRSKGMTVDIWIRDYNPPRRFQQKISGRGKHNVHKMSTKCTTISVLNSALG
jgi:hypothetical protein